MSPGGVPCPACAQRLGGPEAPVSLALEEVPCSQRRGQQPRCSASSPSSSSPSRRLPRSSPRPRAAPCPCPAQSQPRCPRPASVPDSYLTLGGPLGSAATEYRGDSLGDSGAGIFFFQKGRPRRAEGRKCRSLEPRGEGGPLFASAWIDAGWPQGLRDVRETALPRATPGSPPGRQNGEGLVPGRWLHLIPQLLGSCRRKARSPTARPSLRPAPPPESPAGGVAGQGGRKWPLAVCGSAVLQTHVR